MRVPQLISQRRRLTTAIHAVALLCLAQISFTTPASAAHRCQAVAQAPWKSAPTVVHASTPLLHRVSTNTPTKRYQPKEVTIRYIAHSTFLITSPGGTTVATDYFGASGGVIPTAVTMNHAHETHWTANPDPKIKHVLKGWGEKPGEPARHDLEIGDLHVKNVPTNIRNWAGDTELNGNSIFVFAVAGLCIGHLGHLHHPLTDSHIIQIGQLDIVMVPVDGSMTLDHPALFASLAKLRTRVILPMHWFTGYGLDQFLLKSAQTHAIVKPDSDTVKYSIATLPKKPSIVVLKP